MYAKVTKLIKWKHLYKWLLQRLNRLKSLTTSYDTSGCLQFLNVCLIIVTWNVTWLVAVYQSIVTEMVFLVGPVLQ